MTYFERIIDITTGKETIRDYTKEEIAEVEKAKAEAKALSDLYLAKETARASALAKLAALGLTEDEIAALQDHRRLHFRGFADNG